MIVNKPEDCQSLLTAGHKRSGEYTIWINGVTPTVVYCDMVTEGGGWTVFQKRVDGSTNFYRGWDEYKRGFGNRSNNFWLGLDAIHALSKDGASLRVDLTTASGSKYYARYLHFKIGPQSDKYKLEVSGYSGTSGDSMIPNSGYPFSAKDRDNDSWQPNSCAIYYKGAWWYSDCYFANLNGLYSGTQFWNQYIAWHGLQALTFVEMKIRGKACIQPAYISFFSIYLALKCLLFI